MRFSESLRFRIQVWHGLLLAATLTGLSLAAYRYQAADHMRRVDDELREYGRLFRNKIAPPRRPDGAPVPPQELRPPGPRSALFDSVTNVSGVYYAIWRQDGSLQTHSNDIPADLERPEPPLNRRQLNERALRAQGRLAKIIEPFGAERTRLKLREAYQFTPQGECLLVGRSIERDQAELSRYAHWLEAISASVLALGLTVGWWITNHALRPIGLIVNTAKRIARGELDQRIPVSQPESELGGLSCALNDTFAQLEESFARQSRFTADAAHELRTPVTILLTQAQHALMRERDPATYQKTLEVCVNAARRLRGLTESLLELTKLDADAVPLKREPCDLAELSREVVTLVQALADERRIGFAGELAPAICRVDAARISQVLMNLITNALEHTPENGCITLLTGVRAGQPFFSVTDTGPGIPADHLPRIFDRFYRTDDSRNRRSGGAGLGLAICRAIAEAHEARLVATSQEGEGSTFTLSIPA